MLSKLINPHPYMQWLLERILFHSEKNAPRNARVFKLSLNNLKKEIYDCGIADRFSDAVFLDPAGHLKHLETMYKAMVRTKAGPDAEAAVKECIAKLSEQPDISAQLQTSPDISMEVVSREKYETMRADRDSWKDAYGESNELAAAEVKRRESVERENQRLRRIIVQHLPHDSVCALCAHFAQCKQDALEEDDVKAQEETIFWNCDGFSRFVPKEEG